MNGDLSLSQTFGGLRIANPDATTASPSPPVPEVSQVRPPPPLSSHSSSSTLTTGLQRQSSTHLRHSPSRLSPVSPLETCNSTLSPTAPRDPPLHQTRLIHRQSMPFVHQAQQQLQYSAMQNTGPSQRTYPPVTPRPISGMYSHANASASSQNSSYSAYRYGDEPPQQPPVPIMQRSSSRAHSSSYTAQVPAARDSGLSDRHIHSQSESMQAGSHGMAPPRRSSRRGPPSGGIQQPQMAQYAAEGVPQSSSEEWQERGAAVGVRQEVDANGNRIQRILKKGVKDFNFGRTLGEGSYSTVLAATDRQTLREYAIKVLDKRHIIKEKKVKYVNIERDTLNRLTDHPGIVKLYYTFQDERSLYFVLDLASNGELLGVLKSLGTFDIECAQFYSAQILDAIGYIHSRGVIHRDLKPENVLLDAQMHVKITDFGTAKLLDLKKREAGSDPLAADSFEGSEADRAQSFVGTAEYVSPELLVDKNACKASDLWAFGCIVYQLLAGRPPFKAANEYLTFQKIVALEYDFPPGFPSVARDLVERLLVLDPVKRLPVEHSRNHAFFDGITWGKEMWKQKAPRLKAYTPPSQAPIQLNTTAVPPASSSIQSTHPVQPKPMPRVITELPPPSQLDIDWSPVLTRNNERILKLGNLIVTSHPQPHSPNSRSPDAVTETPKKFSRFFGGNTTRKRQRLVMVTSSGRIIVAAAGGDEKKAKMDISLMSQDMSWKAYKDSKGLTSFCVDSRDKHIVFEDPKATSADPEGSRYCCEEWLDALEKARELALSQSLTVTYSNDSAFNDLSSLSSPSESMTGGGDNNAIDGVNVPTAGARLRREHGGPGMGDEGSMKKGKRFSKRHSKGGGLAAVF